MPEQKKSILIVDDDKASLQLISRSLSKKYQVYEASSASDAMSSLHKHYVDLVISDHCMPDKTGLELFTEIDGKFPALAKILITAYFDLDEVVNATNSRSVDKCIKKPWNSEQHLPVIQESLENLEKKRLEAQMIHNSQLASLGELAAGIVHELNNPLAFIDANLKNLNKFLKKIMGLLDSYDELNLPEEIKEEIKKRKEDIKYDYLKTRIMEIVEKSGEGADRMKKIIMNMKNASRRVDDKFEEADINEALDSTLNMIVHEYKNKIEINKNYSLLSPVKCNIAKLSQVFMNLLVNACHAIKEKGEITIKTSIEGEMLFIAIADTGEGIPENMIAKMFESFFTTKGVGKGTGLGLSISQRIIKEHKGEITVDSKLGEGTTFTIKFPTNLKEPDLEE